MNYVVRMLAMTNCGYSPVSGFTAVVALQYWSTNRSQERFAVLSICKNDFTIPHKYGMQMQHRTANNSFWETFNDGFRIVLQLTASPWTAEARTRERWQFGALTNRKATSSNRDPSLTSLFASTGHHFQLSIGIATKVTGDHPVTSLYYY